MATRVGRVESFIRRDAQEIKNYRRIMKLVPIAIGIMVLIIVISYVTTVLYNKFGSFTVMVNKFENMDYGLALSPTPGFETPTARLNCHAEKEITNISGSTLPSWLDNVDGEHNGENYVACTFYCKNMGKQTLDYNYELYIVNMTKDIEKAVRVRVYVDGESVDYAYPRTDGVEDGPEPGTTKFYAGETITWGTISRFHPDDVTKYTVVIWLEGDDPECVDSIIGGEFKIDMTMTVINAGKDYESEDESAMESREESAS